MKVHLPRGALRTPDVASLQLHRGPFTDAVRRTAHRTLLADVLGLDPATAREGWTVFALFEGDGRCAANVEAAILPLWVDGRRIMAAGLRSVAVAERWRGHGLFRALMIETLAWCDSRASGPTLLYTAEPALYERFGFRATPQHAFIGQAPPSTSTTAISASAARTLDPSGPQDRALITKIVEARAPLSMQVALDVPVSLFLTNLANSEASAVALVGSETLVVFEEDGDTLVIADVVAPAMPPLAILLEALGRRTVQVKTSFPPDRLAWRGRPVVEDTGLMARGNIPAAMTRPFMFPPTAEF